MVEVNYKFVDAALGLSLMAVARSSDSLEWKVCFVAFPNANPASLELENLLKLYPYATMVNKLQYEQDIVDILDGAPCPSTLPVLLDGTKFTIAVWEELMKIPYGTVVSYSTVARSIGCPDAYRAVARACSRNHIALIVPCHRVVAANGSISGFGWGVENKKMLLRREGLMKYT